MYRASTAGLTWAAGKAGHEAGDYLAQRDDDARNKQCHTRPEQPLHTNDTRASAQRRADGIAALTRHVTTYGAAQLAAKLLADKATGVHVPLRVVLAGQAFEVALHAVIDDGRLLARFADATNKRSFYQLAANGVNGRMLMDQATHQTIQIPIGSLIIAAVAARTSRR